MSFFGKLIFAISTLFWCGSVIAQNQQPQVIPPPPDVAALIKYAEVGLILSNENTQKWVLKIK